MFGGHFHSQICTQLSCVLGFNAQRVKTRFAPSDPNLHQNQYKRDDEDDEDGINIGDAVKWLVINLSGRDQTRLIGTAINLLFLLFTF